MSTVSVGTQTNPFAATGSQAVHHHGHGGAAAMEAQLNQVNAQIKKLGGSPVSPGKGALKQARDLLQQLQQQQQAQQGQPGQNKNGVGVGVGAQGKSTGIPSQSPTLLGSSSPVSTLTGSVAGGASGVALPATAIPPAGAATQLDLSA